ncbi:MAG: hypothetical protein DSY75_02055 [Alteromonas sp.]|nr:MAG: hypothetical protein DSY75_02055 [Alteromonas sp.]
MFVIAVCCVTAGITKPISEKKKKALCHVIRVIAPLLFNCAWFIGSVYVLTSDLFKLLLI